MLTEIPCPLTYFKALLLIFAKVLSFVGDDQKRGV